MALVVKVYYSKVSPFPEISEKSKFPNIGLTDPQLWPRIGLVVGVSAARAVMEVRLASLTHAELVGLAAEACRNDAALRAKADALIARAAPMPSWIQDAVLFSPDLTPMLIRCCISTRHYEHPLGAVASVCHLWCQLWNRVLREERVVRPSSESAQPWKDIGTLNARVVLRLPNGCLCVGTEGDTGLMRPESCRALRIFSPEAELLRTVNAVRSIVAVACDGEVVFVAHHAGEWGEGSVTRFSLDFDLLGVWPLDDVFGPFTVGVTTRAHQMACTQHALCMTDPEKVSILQTATGNVIGTTLHNTVPSAVAADDESFYVSCLSDHSVKRLNANGEILHSFQGSFHYPTEVAVLNGSLFLTESRGCMLTEWKNGSNGIFGSRWELIKSEERGFVGRRLFVLDLPSGSQRQIIRLKHVIDSLSDLDDTSGDPDDCDDDGIGVCALGVNSLGLYDDEAERWALLHVP